MTKRVPYKILRAEVERLKEELEIGRMVWRHGTPYDPTGVKNATEITSLRKSNMQAEADLARVRAEGLEEGARLVELADVSDLTSDQFQDALGGIARAIRQRARDLARAALEGRR